MYIKQI